MNGFDLIVLTIVAVAAIGGFLRGFVQELLSLATWFLAAFSIRFLHTPVYEVLVRHIRSEETTAIIAFAVLLIIPYAGMKLIAGRAAENGAVALKPFDRVLGFAFGLVKGAIIAVFAFCLIAFAFDDDWSITGRPTWVATARTYPAINAATNELVPMIAARRAVARQTQDAGEARAEE